MLRLGAIVHHTMTIARINATSASKKIHPIALPVHAVRRYRHLLSRLTAACLVAAGLVACTAVAPPKPTPPAPTASTLPAQYRPVAWTALPGWNKDPLQQAWPAFEAGCRALLASASRQALWQSTCTAGATVDGSQADAVRAFFESHFIPYQITAADGRDSGLITGYYEPLLAGSRTESARYAVPLYAVPDDLLIVDLSELYPELKGKRIRGRLDGRRVVPYWTRAEIEAGQAPLADKVLVYVDDPVEAFFLQIQGSGRIKLEDGSVMRVGYADQNGQPYVAIGRVLVDRGELPLERTSMQAIREWGRRHPEQLPDLLNENRSYVFFREVPPPAPGSLAAVIDGPYGALGVPLLRERTLAVDPHSVPLGAPVYLATNYPQSDQPLQRLMLAQDTGGAIRGAVRGDFFWGFGDEAGREAGRMRQQGQMWVLWPKDAPPPKP